MEFTLFCYQVIPGSDDLLHFAPTLQERQQAAIEHRQELHRDQEFDETYQKIGAMAVYRVVLRPPDQKAFLQVLNEEKALVEACLVKRELVALVAD